MISTNWKISTKLELELNVSNAKIFAYFINFYSQNYSLYSSIYLQIIKLLRLLNYLIELLTQFECRSNILIAENLEFITRNCDNHFFFFFQHHSTPFLLRFAPLTYRTSNKVSRLGESFGDRRVLIIQAKILSIEAFSCPFLFY